MVHWSILMSLLFSAGYLAWKISRESEVGLPPVPKPSGRRTPRGGSLGYPGCFIKETWHPFRDSCKVLHGPHQRAFYQSLCPRMSGLLSPCMPFIIVDSITVGCRRGRLFVQYPACNTGDEICVFFTLMWFEGESVVLEHFAVWGTWLPWCQTGDTFLEGQ